VDQVTIKFAARYIWFLLAGVFPAALVAIGSGSLEARLLAAGGIQAIYGGMIRLFGRGFVIEGLIVNASLAMIAFFILRALPMLGH
jgi:hypothetical protein